MLNYFLGNIKQSRSPGGQRFYRMIFDPKIMAAASIEDQVKGIKERRAGALEELVKTYTRPLMAAAFAMGFSETDAEELAQDSFVSFLEAVDRFEGRSQLKTYLFGILYNKASTLRQKRWREEGAEDIEKVFDQRFNSNGLWSAPPQGPEDAALTREIKRVIEKCAENLPAQQRTAFFLKEAEGESSESVCNILGISPTHLRVLLFRARVKLRECLERNWNQSQ